MTKKHFIALADTLKALEPINLKQKDARASAEHRQWETTVQRLADFCAAQNDQFNRKRWLGYIAGSNGKNGGRCQHVPNNPEVMQTVCTKCGKELDLRSKPRREYQPKTGQPCSCRPGMQRDNCPQCEGTGQRIDFAAIRGAR